MTIVEMMSACPKYSIAVFSVIVTLISTLVQKHFTDQEHLKALKKRQKEIQKEIKKAGEIVVGAVCGDGSCDGGEGCSDCEVDCGVCVVGECSVDGDCDDSNVCTDDSCSSGSCLNVDNDVGCDDGVDCTMESCSLGSCVVSGLDDSACGVGFSCEVSGCVEDVVVVGDSLVYEIVDDLDDGYMASDGGDSWFTGKRYVRVGTYWSDYIDAFRFEGVEIPQGAVIDSAVLDVICQEASSSEFGVSVYAEDTDDSSVLSGNTWERVRTSAVVDWTVGSSETWSLNESYSSPDLAEVVQEVVDRDGWVSGNALTVLVDQGSGVGYRNVYPAGGGNGAVLRIDYG